MGWFEHKNSMSVVVHTTLEADRLLQTCALEV